MEDFTMNKRPRVGTAATEGHAELATHPKDMTVADVAAVLAATAANATALPHHGVVVVSTDNLAAGLLERIPTVPAVVCRDVINTLTEVVGTLAHVAQRTTCGQCTGAAATNAVLRVGESLELVWAHRVHDAVCNAMAPTTGHLMSTFLQAFAGSDYTCNDTAGLMRNLIAGTNGAGVFSSAQQPLVVFVSAAWCAPCRRARPVVQTLSNRYSTLAMFVDVDADAHPGARAVVAEGQKIPYLAVVRHGKVVDGIQTSDAAAIDKFLLQLNFQDDLDF
jgi:thiol-disulfide isomerase/thioredoxin